MGRRVTVAVAAVLAPLLMAGPVRAAPTATITGSFTDSCRDFAARSSKDISHVVINYADGRVVKDETIDSRDWSIDGGLGDEISSARVKSGRTVQPFDCIPAIPDTDGDGVLDADDNCVSVPNADQADLDGDGVGDACDTDDDGDGRDDGNDNCPLHPNADQRDTDGDGKGDACDADSDADGVANQVDNCPSTPNTDQADNDEDGTGDACDPDDDNDGVEDADDNCPRIPNAHQADLDGDNVGDVCDPDDDNDDVDDPHDNCPRIPNGDQADEDADGTGDACDDDRDGDGLVNGNDNCPATSNPDQADQDHDGVGDACDDDSDSDDDGHDDGVDNCPADPNPDQSDLDRDGAGDACDSDDDADGVVDAADNCPVDANADQADRDGDGRGDVCDPNGPPLADAGPDKTVDLGTNVALDASGSSDPDGDVLTYAWSLSGPDGSSATLDDPSAVDPSFTPDVPGVYAATLIVHDGLDPSVPDVVEIRVTAPELTIAVEDDPVGIDRTTNGIVTVSEPAPLGGLEIAMSVNHPAIGTVSPTTITIATGSSTGEFTLTGHAAGFVQITASNAIAGSVSLVVEVTDRRISLGTVPLIAPQQTVGLPLSITRPAPPGGVTMTLESENPATATVSPTAFIAEGSVVPTVNPQVTGVALGTTTIIAKAPGFAPDRRDVEVKLILTFSRTTIEMPKQWTETVVAQLSAPAPTGGIDVDVSVDAPLAEVQPTVHIPAGSTLSAPVPVTALDTVGTTTLRGQGTGTTAATATVRVIEPPAVDIRTAGEQNVNQFRVGRDLQLPIRVALQRVPQEPIDIEITVSDGSVARLVNEASRSQAGQPSIVIPNVTSTSSIPIYVQGLTQGNVSITASAPRYASDTDGVEVTPSGFGIASEPFSTTTFSANTQVFLRSHGIDPVTRNTYEFLGQEVRGGHQVSVPLASTNSDVGTLTASEVVFAGGSGSTKSTFFDPISSGTTNITVSQPSGFIAPTSFSGAYSAITATVDAPDIEIRNINEQNVNQFRVGKDLQTPVRVRLMVAPPSPVDVTVTVAAANASVVDSANRTSAGTQTIVIPNLTGSRDVYVQGLTLGSTQITASAPGYDSDTDGVEVTPSGFGIASEPFSTTTFSANTQVFLRSHGIDPVTRNTYEFLGQEVRGGHQVSVPLASTNSDVGTLTASEVVFAGGSGSTKSTFFDPISSGTTNITVSQPSGFIAPTSFSGAYSAITATVDAPDIEIRNINEQNVNQFRVGKDLQTPVRVRLMVAPPSPVDVTVTVAAANASVVDSANRTSAGTQTIVIPNLTGSRDVYVQGLTLGSTQITASAPGYDSDTDGVEVTPSGFGIASEPFSTTTFSANTQVFLRSHGIDPVTRNTYEFLGQEVRGGHQVSVPLASTNSDVGTLTASEVVFAGGSGSTKSTFFDPISSGTTNITVSQPGGFIAPTSFSGAYSAITATVRPPEVRLVNAIGTNLDTWRVGQNLQDEVRVLLEVAPPEPIDVTVSITTPSLAAVSADRTAAGTASVTFTGVTSTLAGTIRVQSLARGGTTMVGKAGGYADDVDQVEILPSGFAFFSSSFSTPAAGANRTIELASYTLDPSTNAIITTHELRGGMTVNVPVASSNPAVGVLTDAQVVFPGGVNARRSTQFDPISAGSTTLSFTQPAGFTNPFTSQLQITATVTS